MSGKSPPPGWGGFPRNGNRKFLWALLAVAILSVTVTASYSFLTIPMSTVANSFGLGATDITVDEPNVDDPGDVPLGPDAKNVRVEYPPGPNNVPGVVRVMIVPVWSVTGSSDSTGGNFGALAAPDANNRMALGDLILDFAPDWASNWFFNPADGYFYYRTVLVPSASASVYTSLLLTGVEYAPGYNPDDYEGKTLHVEVLADILQAAGGAPETEWGVNVSSDGTVSP